MLTDTTELNILFWDYQIKGLFSQGNIQNVASLDEINSFTFISHSP